MSLQGKLSVALVTCLMLAACGGGGGDGGDGDVGGGSGGGGVVPSGDRPAGDPSFEIGTRSEAVLTFIGFEGDASPRSGESRVNLATGVVTGALAGRLDAARTRIDLDDGGTILLSNPATTEYARLFEKEATSGTGKPFFGVVGFPSAPGDMPSSGRVSYTGETVLTASDATRRYDLAGTAFIVTDFGNDRVRIELNDLGGTAQGITGNTGVSTIAGSGQIVIDDSRISGATFAGGSASVSGLPFTFPAGTAAPGTRGAFYGTEADEVAGRIAIDVPASDVEVLGSFIAE
jgi:hypothetical protein